MTWQKIAIYVFVLLFIGSICHIIYYYPILPERVVSHFGPSGKPDNWSNKQLYMGIYAGTCLFFAVTFIGIALGAPKLPTWTINLPNKDYWLAAERKEQTLRVFADSLLWFGSATFAFLIWIFHQSFRVSLGQGDKLENIWLIFAAYLVFITFWGVKLFKRFKRPSRSF